MSRPPNPIRLLERIVRIIPTSVLYCVAHSLGWIGYAVNRGSRERAIRNVQICFPSWSRRSCRQIAAKGFQHMALCGMDLIRFSKDKNVIKSRIHIRDDHHIVNALAAGRGVVLVTGHYGSISVLPAAFDGISSEPAYIMRRPTRKVSWVIRQARAYRDQYLKPLSSFRSLDSSVADGVKLSHLLKQGNVVMVLADLTWQSGTVLVNLFDVPYLMSRMPASLAIRTNAVLIPVMTYRNDDGIYEVVVDPPIERPVDLDDRTAKEQMMRSFAQILERYLRTDPTQWCWTHRQGWQEGSLAKHSTAQTTNPVNG